MKSVNSVPMRHPADEHDADRVARDGARRRSPSVSGKCPATVATVVIRIGRRRVVAATRAPRRSCSCPCACWALANSTIRMPFFDTRPTSVTSPTCE